jgi:methyl-accepting chemotaxis protein
MENNILLAIQQNMAIAQFDLDGKITDANANFLNLMGHKKKTLIGKYHCVFVDERYKNGPGYGDFWYALCQGNTVSSEFRRLRGDNKEVWIQAIYYPVKSCDGKVTSVAKIAIEISRAKAKYYDNYILLKKMEAINSKIPIIEFSMDGTIIDANQSYLKIFGYELNEIINKKHSMFIPEYLHNSKEYHDFWDILTSSQISEGDFIRIGKNGKKVHLNAIYYPIINENGHCQSIIKIATSRDEKNKIADEKHELLGGYLQSIRENSDLIDKLFNDYYRNSLIN